MRERERVKKQLDNGDITLSNISNQGGLDHVLCVSIALT